MPQQKRGPGHPSPYAGREMEISEQICARLEMGEPLAAILRENSMPGYDAVDAWREKYPEIDRIFRRARARGFDVIAADCLGIADDASNDTITTEHGDIPNTEWIQRSKLRVETRLKLLAKWDPKRYGDAPAQTNVQVGVAVNNVLSEERRAELRNKKQRAIAGERKPALTNGTNGNGKH